MGFTSQRLDRRIGPTAFRTGATLQTWLLAAVTAATATAVATADIGGFGTLGVGLGIVAVAVLLTSRRLAISLSVLFLYLALADGYVKLKTGNAYLTLVRDALLY